MKTNSLKNAYKKKLETVQETNNGLLPGQKWAYIYTRVSLILDKEQKKNGDSHSLVHQDSQISEYCKNNNLVILEKFSDPSISGRSIKERKGLCAMLDALKKDIVVVVASISRLSRNTEDLLSINRIIIEKGAELKVVDLPLSPSTPAGEMMLGILGSLVTMERKQNNLKISQTMQSMKKSNTLYTKSRYGFRLVNKVYVEHEEEQKVISAIKLILEEQPDISYGNIVRILDEEGFKNKKGNTFHVSTIKSIINEIYNPSNKDIKQFKKGDQENEI
jgi:DNA invertase Pin-like site-specific DNA recombinase